MISPDNTVILLPSQSINDASGNIWSVIDGQVVVNGVADPATGNVTEMAYEKGVVWQKNSDNLWWSKASPSDAWSPPYGTSVNPTPISSLYVSLDNGVVLVDPAAAPSGDAPQITDASGNMWSIAGGQVTLNGIVDPTTANVTELAYVGGKIWQENADSLWWSKSKPSDLWGPVYGTPVSPVNGGHYDFAVGSYDLGTLTVPGTGDTLLLDNSVVTTAGIHASGSVVDVNDIGGNGRLVIHGDSSLTHGASLQVGGQLHGPLLENDGTMTVSASRLGLEKLSGQGIIHVTDNSTLAILAATPGETIQLESGHLSIGGGYHTSQALSFLAPITGFGADSSITVPNIQATREVFTKSSPTVGELFLYNGSSLVADLHVSGQAKIYATNDPTGGPGSVILTPHDSGHSIPITTI